MMKNIYCATILLMIWQSAYTGPNSDLFNFEGTFGRREPDWEEVDKIEKEFLGFEDFSFSIKTVTLPQGRLSFSSNKGMQITTSFRNVLDLNQEQKANIVYALWRHIDGPRQDEAMLILGSLANAMWKVASKQDFQKSNAGFYEWVSSEEAKTDFYRASAICVRHVLLDEGYDARLLGK